jgi:hypothetical protein
MGDFFYSIGLFIIILNLASLLQYKKIFDITEWLSKYKLVTGKNPVIEDFRNKGDHDLLLFWSFTVVSTVMWMLFGLLSNQWGVFLFIFLVNIALNSAKKIFSSIRKIKLLLTFIKSFIGLSIIVFLVLNYFHFKLDLMDLLFGHHH